MGKFFGTDGIRGIANKDLTPEMAFKLGRAVAHVLASDYEDPVITIGKDTRISGDMLESALAAGICSRGVSVYHLGVLPTPGIAYLTRHLKAQAGAVISASHNPMQDNGIKFFNQYGFKLSDEIEAEIESYLLNDEEDIMPRPTGKDVGHLIYLHKGKGIYEAYLKKIFNDTLEGLNIVVDNANGAASNVMPNILRSLEPASLISISDEPNGININEDCGSTHMENLRDRVIQCKADIGIAHDGDADRMLAVDELGRVVDGDQIMAICAGYLKEKGELKNNLLVGTVMSNLGLRKFCEERDIDYSATGVGDRYVLEEMVKRDAILGGEQSGHIIFKEYNTTGDGLLTALMLMKVMKEKKQKLSTLADQMKIYPQTLRNVKVANKEEALNNVAFKKAIEEAGKTLENRSRILVRPSGTESLIRIMAEGENLEEIESIVKDLAKIIQ
ncbi:phosphoglucosamine mutase [endosymbiont 'TC1' of Trimyema compressum]|uniref:phosphoglucosamine mutase n=1 Tax=endosymbiont 'TC1' of Trimyema compressum TaxID=243899 RepID=UPI0007F0A456|nr:phosphoglucosamine mutase [endosymbiont 'TC1' of Trimyema compressum]AMP20941.1 phosphoglucosamine mutase [endosymbiont 'TC1' of Trimyema compressum]